MKAALRLSRTMRRRKGRRGMYHQLKFLYHTWGGGLTESWKILVKHVTICTINLVVKISTSKGWSVFSQLGRYLCVSHTKQEVYLKKTDDL